MKRPKSSTTSTKAIAPKTEIDRRMLELLACPLTKGSLTWDADRCELISRAAKLAYPVRDGIPVMLPSEARTLPD